MNQPNKPYFTQALDALRSGDRRGAAALLQKELRFGNTAQKNLPSVAELAAHIGEIDMAIDAARRAVVPGRVDTMLAYWAVLATYGRSDEAIAQLSVLPASLLDQAPVLHFRGTFATELGRFEEAQELFRAALAKAPGAMETWFALAMIKTFQRDDPELLAMQRLERDSAGAPPIARAALCYAIGKAREDCGDVDRAFEYYSKGAALRRREVVYEPSRFAGVADQVIADWRPDNVRKLTPSGFDSRPTLFVTGLPRSGTTLTEQILVGHPAVSDGAELNLFAPAAMPAGGGLFKRAMAFQQQSTSADPWGDIARDYTSLVEQYFGGAGLVVDKSLGQSLLIGVMLQSLPDAQIAWLRRSPDDVALSCFKTFFTTGLPWTWSLTDIADQMRAEDRLFAHWQSLYPDRILAVPYEELVAKPKEWAERLQEHFSLASEEGLEDVARSERPIRTASVAQARRPITGSSVGQAAKFEKQLRPFRERYYR